MAMYFPLRLHFRELGHYLSRFESDVSFLPVRTMAHKASAPAELAFEIRGANFGHLHIENLFHCLAELDLVGIARYFERQRSFRFLLRDAFFGDQGPLQDVIERHNYWASFGFGADFASDSLSFDAAACVSRMRFAPSR